MYIGILNTSFGLFQYYFWQLVLILPVFAVIFFIIWLFVLCFKFMLK